MNVYDCFMYYDEDLILDLRLNLLNKYVNKFVIVESKFTHSGKKRNLRFDIKNFQKFRDKIIYIPVDTLPESIEEIKISDTEDQKNSKILTNAVRRENFQRNQIELGLKDCNENDLIIISDVDEIPNLENFFHKNKISVFYQKMFYYKFNLKHPFLNFIGSKACKKKYLKSPQWLRNIKSKMYQYWRIDVLFSKKKYFNLNFVDNGGWHFSSLKNAEGIHFKMSNFLHHLEYEESKTDIKDIEKLIKEKKIVYDHRNDKKNEKYKSSISLIKINNKELPNYLIENKKKYIEFFD
jgi:beta-1,4-mannosyl-glycoprotein beta-1,4-N-acetylglucosaminyltransferase